MTTTGDLVTFHKPGQSGYEYARSLVLYDYRQRPVKGPGTYRVTVFQNHASEHSGARGRARYDAYSVLRFTIVVTNAGARIETGLGKSPAASLENSDNA
jgi:hypothetical protein